MGPGSGQAGGGGLGEGCEVEFSCNDRERRGGCRKAVVEFVKERAHLDAECTEDEVAKKARWWEEAMSSILDDMAKRIRICAKPKRWWNTDMNGRKQKQAGRRKRC